MPIRNNPASQRQWQRLGNTLIDLAPVVKIEFERGDARLFVISGEALLMTAWTESRTEIAALKQHALERNGWIIVADEAQELTETEYTDADMGVYENDASSARNGNTDPSVSVIEDAPPAAAKISDHRVRLAAVDRLVYVPTAAGQVVELSASGVFLGNVVGRDSMDELESGIGIE